MRLPSATPEGLLNYLLAFIIVAAVFGVAFLYAV
jgi:hypothetical protein